MNLVTLSRQNKDTSETFRKLQQNTTAIIDFLTELNPRLNKETLMALFNLHLDILHKQVSHTSKQESIASMSTFDAYNKNIQDILDYLEDACWQHLIGPGPRYR